MGEIYQKKDKLEKKFNEKFSFKELLKDVDEFEQKLSKMRSDLKDFDSEIKKKDIVKRQL